MPTGMDEYQVIYYWLVLDELVTAETAHTCIDPKMEFYPGHITGVREPSSKYSGLHIEPSAIVVMRTDGVFCSQEKATDP